MKTFAKYVLNDDAPMRIENLLPALIVTVIALAVAVSVGALVAGLITDTSEPAPFRIYVGLGVILLGIINGISTLIGIFVAIMKVPTK